MTHTLKFGHNNSDTKVTRQLIATSHTSDVAYTGHTSPTKGALKSSVLSGSRRPQKISILGATGSVGRSTLDVVSRNPELFNIFALSGFTNLIELERQCLIYRPAYAVVPMVSARELQDKLINAGLDTQVLSGETGLQCIASHPDVDTVVAAIVGAAGLSATLAAIKTGKKILLANKEALVMSGALFMQSVKEHGAILLPIDSEHNAISQCLPPRLMGMSGNVADVGVRRVMLTASGGPFRKTSLADLYAVTPEQACAHPVWSMGRKISVDSASLMNKGLELIEACWLFNTTPEKIEVIIHPQSIVHSLVDYIDGSVLAHMGNPDMRVPISHALAWPQRIDSGVPALNLFDVGRLDFEAPDETRFPCLTLAKLAAKSGGTAPALLNAANEVAVQAFLSKKIGFMQISELIDSVLNAKVSIPAASLDVILEADAAARRLAQEWLNDWGC
ncbi:1-deoxy-D-xylulose 5-phosphate reductoisomerase [compost metagenome]